jgi:phage repressor protein C with HTH and peptisase S24 domain
MQPTFKPGDTLVGWRWSFELRPGQVVVAWQGDRPIIKRLGAVTPTTVVVLGDNPEGSTDSRHYGPLLRSSVEAKILAKL